MRPEWGGQEHDQPDARRAGRRHLHDQRHHPPRQARRREGKTYEHVTKDEFYRRLDADQFLEYARVYGEYYATPKLPALDELAGGRDVLMEIDVQGALQVRHHYPQAVTCFILPPDEATLLQRLTDRARDSADEVRHRLRAAKREIHMAKGSRAFDHMVINDDLEEAVAGVEKVLRHKRAGGGL